LATVITNLMSAIPWVGQDIVEFLWGGLIDEPDYGDIVFNILLIAENSTYLNKIYVIIYVLYMMFYVNMYVKMIITKGKSAGVRSISTTEASQRPNAEDLIYAYIVGLFEGDGYFSISKKGNYLTYEVGIELNIRDIGLLYKLKSILGVGVISFRERNGVKTASLRIRDKDHLKKYIIPIFDKYPMFSNKAYDYFRFRDILLSNVIKFSDLTEYVRSEKDLNTVEEIIKSHYFAAWLVGFIEAEGCFSIYKLNQSDDYMVASFDISQTKGEIIIKAIAKYLSFTTKINVDHTQNYKLKVTGVRSIENIIKFLDKAPLKLMGHKKLQYLLWIKKLRTISRYNNYIRIPSNY